MEKDGRINRESNSIGLQQRRLRPDIGYQLI
jgi:hypothetical protein